MPLLVAAAVYGGAIVAASLTAGVLPGGPVVVLVSYLLAAFLLVRLLSRFA